jgi:hypothetical protein
MYAFWKANSVSAWPTATPTHYSGVTLGTTNGEISVPSDGVYYYQVITRGSSVHTISNVMEQSALPTSDTSFQNVTFGVITLEAGVPLRPMQVSTGTLVGTGAGYGITLTKLS